MSYHLGGMIMRSETLKQAILAKHRANIERIGDAFPHVTENGIYDRGTHCFWTGGFYAGLSRLCYELSHDEVFYEHATRIADEIMVILRKQGKSLGHDIGMLVSPGSYGAWQIKQDQKGADQVIEAADVLIQRFHEEGSYIQAWDANPNRPETEENNYRMIIDCLLNLPLLYRASELSGDPKYKEIATRHAHTARRYLVRADGTTNHTFIFYPNGQPKYPKTHQGYSNSSCWSRGQGWAIYGFAMCYRFTGEQCFLDTAIRCADTFLDLCEPNGIPKWDFHFKGRRSAPRDTSAATISACGMMEIFDATGDEKWKEAANRILCELTENYTSFDCEREEGILREGTGHMPIYDNINVSLIYGDYYYVELFARLQGISRGYW